MAPTKVKGVTAIGSRKSAKGAQKMIHVEEPVKEVEEQEANVFSKKAMKRVVAADKPVAKKGKRESTKTGKFAQRIREGILAKRPAAAEEESEEIESESDKEVEETEKKSNRKAEKTMKRPAAAADEPVGKKGKKESKMAGEERVVSERTKELKAMSAADLKDLAKSKGLAVALKSEMIESVLAAEADSREELRAREAKTKEIVADIRTDFAAKNAPELKDLCEKEGLKKGGSKDELVDRLVANAKEKGQIERVLEAHALEVRRVELLAMDKDKLCKLCSKAGVDFLVKEVMVERLLTAEMLSKP